MSTPTAVMTNIGFTTLAAAFKNLYLVLESNGSTLSATVAVGVTSIETAARIELAGDSSLVLSTGLATEEVVSFSSVSGSGPYTYTLTTPTTQPHTAGDPCCRLPLATDTMAQVVSEQEYDSVNDPGMRLQSVSSYSTGAGQQTQQFYLTGIEASFFVMSVGVADAPGVGQGNLLWHGVLGVNHTYIAANGGVDLEIDIPISLT